MQSHDLKLLHLRFMLTRLVDYKLDYSLICHLVRHLIRHFPNIKERTSVMGRFGGGEGEVL